MARCATTSGLTRVVVTYVYIGVNKGSACGREIKRKITEADKEINLPGTERVVSERVRRTKK